MRTVPRFRVHNPVDLASLSGLDIFLLGLAAAIVIGVVKGVVASKPTVSGTDTNPVVIFFGGIDPLQFSLNTVYDLQTDRNWVFTIESGPLMRTGIPTSYQSIQHNIVVAHTIGTGTMLATGNGAPGRVAYSVSA